MPPLHIGDVAELAGVTAPTVRYYESIGLIRKAPRATSGYRTYSREAVKDVEFIRKARALGFSLGEIGEIVQLTRSGRKPCSRVVDLARQHLAEVDEQMRKLSSFRNQLAAELARWEEPSSPTGDGLCQMIESSAPAADSELPDRRLKARRARRRS